MVEPKTECIHFDLRCVQSLHTVHNAQWPVVHCICISIINIFGKCPSSMLEMDLARLKFEIPLKPFHEIETSNVAHSAYCKWFKWHVDNKLFAFQLFSWAMHFVHFVLVELSSSKIEIMDFQIANDRTIDGYFGDGSIRTVNRHKQNSNEKSMKAKPSSISIECLLYNSFDASLIRSWTLEN